MLQFFGLIFHKLPYHISTIQAWGHIFACWTTAYVRNCH